MNFVNIYQIADSAVKVARLRSLDCRRIDLRIRPYAKMRFFAYIKFVENLRQ